MTLKILELQEETTTESNFTINSELELQDIGVNPSFQNDQQNHPTLDETSKVEEKNKTNHLLNWGNCYLLQVKGDPEFRLTAKSARKNGVKAEFLDVGWVYQNREDAKEVAERWSQGKRKLSVMLWHDLHVDDLWNGSKDKARLARKIIRLTLESLKANKKIQEIELQCHLSPLHPSMLYIDPSKIESHNLSDEERKAYDYFKPLWDAALKAEEEISLKGDDLSREKEDLKNEIQKNELISFDFIFKCLMRNELGDAELFLHLIKNKYLFDSSEGKNGEFYFWNGTYWKIDKEKQRYIDFKIVSDNYEKASTESGKVKDKEKLSEELYKRSFSLRSSKRCRSVFDFVSPEIHFNGEWDYCPEKLPCLNGLIDLKTGSISDHKPEYFLRYICLTAYNPNAKRPLFDKFLDDITLGDKELKAFLGRVFGYALLGTCREEKVFILYGQNGRNGKGTLMQTLEKVLGSLAKTFPAEMLLLQRNPPSSSTPRPEKANLQGVRFAIFSEIAEKRQIDTSEYKNLSGRDTISCRRLFSNIDIQIRPSHTMFIQTNFKPKASAKDEALWKRSILIPFNAEFVEEPDEKKPYQRKLDEGFKERLLTEREGILAWLIEGCLEYQRIGLSIPKVVKDETENYRQENDGIQLFIDERCILDPVFSTPCRKMQQAIKEYCKEQGHNIPSEREISAWLRNRFGEPRKTEKGTLYNGISIAKDNE